jgi:UDP-N-acetylmuramoyl-tripeptide--D-alanyl-D-alanine ligase
MAVSDCPDYRSDKRVILVDNVLNTLQSLARLHRTCLGQTVIGITGTNGKTTTKELLSAVLSTRYNVLATEGNLNNHIGLPLTLLKLRKEHEVAVIEMGASRRGDIEELAEIARPNFGIITNTGRAHLEGFGTFENLVATKGELYDFIRKTDGTIFRKSSDAILSDLSVGMKQILYGEGAGTLISTHVSASDPYLSFIWTHGGEAYTVNSRLFGKYNVDNAAAAIAVGIHLNVPPSEIVRAIESYRPTNNRSQILTTSRNTVFVDTYNANPDSMKAALSNFQSLSSTLPKAVILGDMKELGRQSVPLHEEIISAVIAGGFDRIILCGEEFAKAAPAFPVYSDVSGLISALKEKPLAGYQILLKASRSMTFERLIPCL